MIDPAQIRAARALLAWNLQDLAERVGMSVNSISKIERELVKPHQNTLVAIEEGFEAAGVEFLPDSGVRKKGNIGRHFDKISNELQELRSYIDEIDDALINILNERAKITLEIGKYKRINEFLITEKSREQHIIERLQDKNLGPLSDDAIEEIIQHILQKMREIEARYLL